MAGQGSPHASRRLPPRAAPWVSRWAWRLLLAAQLTWIGAAQAAPVTLRVRVAWGGGAQQQWRGFIRASEGTLSSLTPLGIEADEPGSIYLDGLGIVVAERSPRAYDGLDITVTAELTAKLVVALSGNGQEATPIEVSLQDLLAQPANHQLDSGRNRLLVSRSPGDALRVELMRDSLVFSPGEQFSCLVTPYLLGLADGTPLKLRAQLIATADGGKVWSKDYDTVAHAAATDGGEQPPAIQIETKLPDVDGVYNLSLIAVNGRLPQRLPWKKPAAERSIQLVVVGSQRRQEEPASGPMEKIAEIDPASSRWWDKLSTVPIPGLRKGPLGSGDAARWEHPKFGQMIQLAEGKTREPSWEAYPLPIDTVGEPHIVEVEYPSDVPQTMGVSIVDPNAAGDVQPIGLDSGVYVSDEEAAAGPELQKHRLVFWPRTKTPLLLITNRRTGARVVYGKIRVLGVAHSRLGALLRTRTPAASLPPAFEDGERSAERLLAGYLDRPLFTENFSALEALDPVSGRSLDDWNTFYQGGNRLVEYLRYAGHNGLMLGVAADGSAIYPSAVLEPTPRYDTGAFFSTGQDPLRKDVLEVLFRLFDRAEMRLIPAVHFATPLPKLEELRRGQPVAMSGIGWIGADGREWIETHAARQGLAPYYNPLNPRVQAAMQAAVRELVERYGDHPSFAGVAMQLSADGWAQLPGVDGPYDDDTIARFERSAKLRVPGAGPTRFAERARFLAGNAQGAWLAWRGRVMADLHRSLAREVMLKNPSARLYLAGAQMFDAPALQRMLRPTLPRRMKADELLLSVGLRPELYSGDQGVVLIRPQFIEPRSSIVSESVRLELNLAPEVDQAFSRLPETAALLFHEPQRARLASFDQKSPFGPTKTYTWLVSQMSPSAAMNRRRFVHGLAALDAQTICDGGWLLSLGQEEALREVAAVYRRLPPVPFDNVPGETQPVVIRAHSNDRETFAYLVNDSPWDAKVTIEVLAPPNCEMESLGGQSSSPLSPAGRGSTWTVQLRPYDLAAARFAAPQVRFANLKVAVAPEARGELEQRIRDLGARTAALGNPAPLAILDNADFEREATGASVPGWTFTEDAGTETRLDPAQPRGGGKSLHVTSTGPRVTVRSDVLPAPQTGRLSLSVWIRSAEKPKSPVVRLAIEGRHDGQLYQRYALVGGVGAGRVPLGAAWPREPYMFQIDDLPAQGLTDVRVRFDLMQAGEVWIDDVQLFDLDFSESERAELTKLITLANFKLQAGQIGDCQRILDGFWPHFLVENVPLSQGPVPLAQRPASSDAGDAAPAAKKPGMIEQMKGLVPRLRR